MLLLKIMLAILATIGAVVVLGIAVIMVMYFVVARRITLNVRQQLQGFEAMKAQAIDADYFRSLDDEEESELEVPPMRIHLDRTSLAIWANDGGVDQATKWIVNNGFEFVGDFLIEELPESRLRVFLSDDRWLVAAIRQDQVDDSAYVEFCFDLGGTRRGGVSNPPHATVPLPEGAIGEHFQDDFYDGVHILPKMLERARELVEDNAVLKVDRGRIEEFFEAAHAAEMDLRIKRGGLTAEEIRCALEQDQQTVSKAEIEVIQRDWQDAIEEFLVEHSPNGTECQEGDGEVIAVL